MRKTYSVERYADRGLKNTDFLAFRCIEELDILNNMYILDVGCGTGRSTNFLRSLGNRVKGVDNSKSMVLKAKQIDPNGQYDLVANGCSFPFEDSSFDGIFSSWMILEEGSKINIIHVLSECYRVLREGGYAIIVSNTLDFYKKNWLSCLTNHIENEGRLVSGQKVKVTLLPEKIEIEDYYWSDEDYRLFFNKAKFTLESTFRPKGNVEDGLPWLDELNYSPYAVYVLRKYCSS